MGNARFIYHCNWQIWKGWGRTRGKRGCYIRFLRRISRSDAANSNYGAGQQLVHQTVFQARKVMPNNPWRRKMSWSALNALLLFIQTWSYESLMILEIMLLWFCLSLHLMLSSCWQDQAVLLLAKFWWWTLQLNGLIVIHSQPASQDNYINKVKCFVAIWNKIHRRSVAIFEKMLLIIFLSLKTSFSSSWKIS